MGKAKRLQSTWKLHGFEQKKKKKIRKKVQSLCGVVITMTCTGHQCLVEPQLPVAIQYRILMLQLV